MILARFQASRRCSEGGLGPIPGFQEEAPTADRSAASCLLVKDSPGPSLAGLNMAKVTKVTILVILAKWPF